MTVKITLEHEDKKANTATFLIKEAAPGFVNALRRYIMTRVPVMAIEDVEFTKNSSALYDEMIALRLGLTALTTDLKSYKTLEESGGELSAINSVKLWCKAKGPGYVYAEQIQTKDPAIKPVYPKTPIVKLSKDQEVEFEATAILGKGKDHAKWSPAHCWHTNVAHITVNANHKDMKEFEDKYPPLAFKNGKLDKKAIEENNLYDAVSGVNSDIVKVEYEENAFHLHVESFGQLSIKEVVAQAIEQLKSDVELLQEKVKA